MRGNLRGGSSSSRRTGGLGGGGVWRDRYRIDVNEIVPGVSEAMAEEVLRLGRGINFLKICSGKEQQGINPEGWEEVDTLR